MGLSPAALDAHIARWSVELDRPYYPHRKLWPGLLFHHAPLQNAVAIIASGQLLSRDHVKARLPLDVAATGVIDNRHRAHEFGRLYFRPCTPTRFNIEGIRRPAECRYIGGHAPILVMFVLDARSILSLPLVRFSNMNMQLDAANDGNDDAFFAAIDFTKVYHEGAWSDPSIKDHRCAEVLCPSPLPINEHLRWRICRSEAERQTLIWHSGQAILPYRDRIRTSDDLRVFEKSFAFSDQVSTSNEGVIFRLNPRKDGQRLKVQVLVTNQLGESCLDVTYPELAAVSDTGASWIARCPLADGLYRVSLFIDEHLAYRNDHYVGEMLF